MKSQKMYGKRGFPHELFFANDSWPIFCTWIFPAKKTTPCRVDSRCDFPILIWVCLKIVYPEKPNGFADHYPVFKWLFHWEH